MTGPGTDVQLSEKTIKMFAEMAGSLEEYDAGGSDAIIQRILSASTVDEYNAVFGGDRAFPLGKEMLITRVRYAKSDFAAGLPFYLVVDATDRKDGEVKEYTIGAESVVAMLTRAAFLEQLPLVGKATQADKETKNGYRPVNWEMLAIGGYGKADSNGK